MKVFMREVQISAIAFDMDGVLVPRPITDNDWYECVIRIVRSKTGETRDQAKARLLEYDIDGSTRQNQGSVTNVMTEIGFSREEWNSIKLKEYDIVRKVKPDNELLSLIVTLSSRFLLLLISNNSLGAVFRNLEALAIPLSTFSSISAYDALDGVKSEVSRYKTILQSHSLSFQELVAVGDKYPSDIEPVLNAGGNGILVEDYAETKEICRLLLGQLEQLKRLSMLPLPGPSCGVPSRNRTSKE